MTLDELRGLTRCGRCGDPPTPDRHKGDDVLVCGSCDRILVRV